MDASKRNQAGSQSRTSYSGRISSKTHQSDQAVRVERVVAREDVELARHERERARRAALRRVDGDEALLQRGDVLLDGVRVARCLVHVRLERVDVRRVALEGGADLFFEVVDDYKVWEEGEDVFDLEEGC